MNKVLLIAPNWIGDALFASSALRLIKKNYPASHCYVLAVERVAEVFRRNPDVTDVIVNEEGKRPFWYGFSLIQRIGLLDFDAAFVLHRSRSRAIGTFLAGIPLRVGFNTKGRGIFLTHAVPLPAYPMHRVGEWQYLLNHVGIAGKAPSPLFTVGEEARARMRARLGDAEYALLNPGGNWLPKRWPVQRFAQLADMIATRLGMRIAVTGAVKDRVLAQEMQGLMRTRLLSLAGDTSLEELGAVIEQGRIFVSNDSGPMHLAAALRTPVIGLFGPTSARITGPIGDGKIVVLQKNIGLPVPNPDPACRDMRYMEAISVEEVFAAAEKILAAHPVMPHA